MGGDRVLGNDVWRRKCLGIGEGVAAAPVDIKRHYKQGERLLVNI